MTTRKPVPHQPDAVGVLLEAGAYLHPDTGDRGSGVAITARAYRRPGMADRTVVRLAPEETGEAEDAAAAFLGLERVGPADVVGFGARERLGFPEWVLLHHPEDGARALALLPEIDRLSRLAHAKASAACDGFLGLGTRLAASVPHFMPTFFERAARELLSAERPDYAARLFGAARKAESEHGLVVDQDRMDDVFVEFILAGALPVKVLSDYSKELALRLSPEEALRRFVRLALRRTSGGLPPTATMAADLRRLAKAVPGDAGKAERSYLAEALTLPATVLAPETWWKAHRAALKALAAERPETRRALLAIVPTDPEPSLVALWLGILEDTGAAALLCAGDLPDGGAVGWLERLLAARGLGYSAGERVAALESLVTRMSGRLKAEIAGRGAPLALPESADLIELLLELEVPVADPGPASAVQLGPWAQGENRKELSLLCADPRFAPALRRALDSTAWHTVRGHSVFAASPATRPHVLARAEDLAGRVAGTGLPTLSDAVEAIQRLDAGSKRIAERAVRAALAVDLPELLARTLRGGLFDELHWPAFEAACAELFPEHMRASVIAEEWPYLVLADRTRALVLDGSGVVLDHALRLPPTDSRWFGFHYADGALLVHWRGDGDARRHGYWHTEPDRVLPLDGPKTFSRYLSHSWKAPKPTLEAPGGGRAVGSAVLRPGDALAPAWAATASDGRKLWARLPVEGGRAWHGVDPGTGASEGPGMPGFFAEPGEAFRGGFLVPFPGAGPTPLGDAVDGLLGQRMVGAPDGTARAEDLAGNASPAVSGYASVWLVRMPGDDRPRALVPAKHGQDTYFRLIGPDGLVLADTRMPRLFAAGSEVTLPPQYWAYLRPRDPRGSAALRRADRALAERLLDGTWETIGERVAEALPEVSDPALRKGVAGIVAAAQRAQRTVATVVRSVETAVRAVVPVASERPSSPSDRAVHRAVENLLDGITANASVGNTALSALLLWQMGRLRAGTAETESPGEGAAPRVALPRQRLHLPWLVDGLPALVLRMASRITPEASRKALRELLALLDEAGLLTSAPGAWRLLRLAMPGAENTRENFCRGFPLGEGAFLAVIAQDPWRTGQRQEVTALFHDPSGAFRLPAGYEQIEELPFAGPRSDVPVAEVLKLLDAQGPAPWRADAVAEFATLADVTPTTAALVVSGLPVVVHHSALWLPDEVRTVLKLKPAEVEAAHRELAKLPQKVRRELVGALLPADPARLWTDGPDVAAAAEVWRWATPRRATVPEALLIEADKAFEKHQPSQLHLRAVLDPANHPDLTQDAEFRTVHGMFAPVGDRGFTAQTLTTSVRMLAWLAHRLPAGDPLRDRLPAGLAAVRERLAHPDLILGSSYLFRVRDHLSTLGPPDEETEHWDRWGAILIVRDWDLPTPGIRLALLDENDQDPLLPLLRGELGRPMPVEVALRTARDERFAALLADPGEPVEGGRLKDGTWYPQDPSRSVPDLVAEVAKTHGLSADAAAVYLMVLAMPDPSDRHTARWTGWRPARLKDARAELAGTDLVTEARRAGSGRTLFLHCPWVEAKSPEIPMEDWKQGLYPFSNGGLTPLTTVVPTEPVADVYRRAWRRIAEGDLPRFRELEIPRAKRRR
ncbi:DNA-binding protein [Actinocorallia aurea]